MRSPRKYPHQRKFGLVGKNFYILGFYGFHPIYKSRIQSVKFFVVHDEKLIYHINHFSLYFRAEKLSNLIQRIKFYIFRILFRYIKCNIMAIKSFDRQTFIFIFLPPPFGNKYGIFCRPHILYCKRQSLVYFFHFIQIYSYRILDELPIEYKATIPFVPLIICHVFKLLVHIMFYDILRMQAQWQYCQQNPYNSFHLIFFLCLIFCLGWQRDCFGEGIGRVGQRWKPLTQLVGNEGATGAPTPCSAVESRWVSFPSVS